MKFHLSVVQPETVHGDDAGAANLGMAWEKAREAATLGADLVVFPESFPGAWRRPINRTPEPDVLDMARELGVYLIAGFAEPIDDAGDRCFNTLMLAGPDGKEVGRYRRTTPVQAPWIYRGGEYWDFEWVRGKDLPVFETDLGKLGMLMCSEVYGPELFRVLALRGAETIVVPGGITSPSSSLFETWRTLIWARAIENLCYVATCSNAVEGEALAMICSPEQILVEAHGPGVFASPIDRSRLAFLRSEADRRIGRTSPWRTKPGVLRDWRIREVLEPHSSLLSGGDPDSPLG